MILSTNLVIFGNNILKNKQLLDFYRKLMICYALNAEKKYFLFDDNCFTMVSKKTETVLFKLEEYLLNDHTIKPVFCKFN
tara:strand:- start:1506 stop:1745 length:240 start_codon:yes stop_codon:yes gene_type:complete